MKAAIYPGGGQAIVIEDRPDPEPGPTDVLIRVHRCGICGTDLAMTKGGMWDYGRDVQFGHEYAGEVVAVGSEAGGLGGYKPGDRIAVLPSGSCGHCAGCAGHNPVLCRNAPSVTFGFSEYARVPIDVAVRLPQTLSMADGALVEPLAVGLYGVRQSRIEAGDTVLVLGGGTVALYAIYWARRLGAGRIVAMSRSERRRDLCLQMGADAFVAFGDNEVGEVVEALGGAPSVVYECVGSEGMLMKAVMHAALYGKVVSLGFCTGPDPVIPAMAAYKCVAMQFLVGYTMRDFRFIADHMDRGHVDPKSIITREIPLVGMPAMFEHLRGANEETKVHVSPLLAYRRDHPAHRRTCAASPSLDAYGSHGAKECGSDFATCGAARGRGRAPDMPAIRASTAWLPCDEIDFAHEKVPIRRASQDCA